MKVLKICCAILCFLILAGCTSDELVQNTGGNITTGNTTNKNKDFIVEWAPFYSSGEQIIDIHSTESQNILNKTKVLAFANQATDNNVSLTTNGCLYNGETGQDGTLFLITLLTNRTGNSIKNIHYDIKITLNSTGEVLGESAFDIPSNIYGDSVGSNKGYLAFLPFPYSPEKATGTVYLKDEITVQTNITYDTAGE
ncbi:hypothetical protein HB943_12955 [Listeria weihenstephanensis]|uniref:Lipoprotein n=1 Tax=Listeria weihenstephanensis TaxID=1006155 RepID=A0A841Z891_9LIST|nr:hypothetical protein [Listeria weihenstephanensis]MBC1501515.1 hypothetical protein [Listeria weihenstephanensis]